MTIALSLALNHSIPVFVSRVFRHSAIYLGENSPIKKPKYLEGKRVGLPEWAQTSSPPRRASNSRSSPP